MFKRLSNAFKFASNDKNYLIMSVILFLTFLSWYVIKSPIIWYISIILIVIMFGMLIRFYILKDASHE